MLVVGSVADRKTLVELLGDTPVVVAAGGPDGLRADVVRNDDHLGMRLVVDYLVAAGHTAVAHLAELGGAVAEERVAAYRAAMAQHGLEPEIVVAEPDFPEDAGYRSAARLLRGERPVTAIAAVNDLAAVGADVRGRRRRPPGAERRCGHRVRRHLRRRDPSGVMTSVNPDSSGIGTQVAHCVLRRIDDPWRGRGRASSSSAAGDALQLGSPSSPSGNAPTKDLCGRPPQASLVTRSSVTNLIGRVTSWTSPTRPCPRTVMDCCGMPAQGAELP